MKKRDEWREKEMQDKGWCNPKGGWFNPQRGPTEYRGSKGEGLSGGSNGVYSTSDRRQQGKGSDGGKGEWNEGWGSNFGEQDDKRNWSKNEGEWGERSDDGKGKRKIIVVIGAKKEEMSFGYKRREIQCLWRKRGIFKTFQCIMRAHLVRLVRERDTWIGILRFRSLQTIKEV